MAFSTIFDWPQLRSLHFILHRLAISADMPPWLVKQFSQLVGLVRQ